MDGRQRFELAHTEVGASHILLRRHGGTMADGSGPAAKVRLEVCRSCGVAPRNRIRGEASRRPPANQRHSQVCRPSDALYRHGTTRSRQ